MAEALRSFVRAVALDPNDATKSELEEVQELRWRSVARRLDVQDLRISEDDDSGNGPGGVIWDCAVCLAQHMTSRIPSIEGKRLRMLDHLS